MVLHAWITAVALSARLVAVPTDASAAEPQLLVPSEIEVAAPLDAPVGTGTETIRSISSWTDTQGEAERMVLSDLEEKETRAIEDLQTRGRRVIGSHTEAVICEEKTTTAETVQFRCQGQTEINWSDESSSVSSRLLQKSDILNNLSARLSDVRNRTSDVGGEDAVARESITLEPDLLNKFKTRYTSPYSAMDLPSLSVVKSDVTVGEVIRTLPVTVNEEKYSFENNTNGTQRRKFKVNVSVNEGETFDFTKKVVTGSVSKYEVKLHGEYKVAAGLGGGASATGTWEKSRTVTIGNDHRISRTVTRSYEEEFEQEVPAMKAIFIKVQRESSSNVYGLTGSVVFDGDVNMRFDKKDVYPCGPGKTKRCKRTKSTYWTMKLSQLLTEAERTVDMSGRVTVSSAANSKTSIFWAEKPLEPSNNPLTTGPSSAELSSAEDNDVAIALPPLLAGRELRRETRVPEGLEFRTAQLLRAPTPGASVSGR